MTTQTGKPIGGAAAWRGADIREDTSWRHPIDGRALAEIDAALAGVAQRGLDWRDITRDNFPLPELSGFLADIADALESGPGVVRFTGIPVDRYSEDQLRRLYFGIACHIGTPVAQNGGRGLMRDIRDSGGKRVDSSGALRWHNDRADVVALFCIRKARAGGLSRIVSAVAIHDAMQAVRPDLAAILYDDFHRSTVGDEVGAEALHYPLPIFATRDGFFTSHYSRTYIEQAQQFDAVPRLTGEQVEALDLLQELAEQLCFEMPIEPGEIQLLNNHIIYHSRTAFEDDAAHGLDRLLYRIWLSMPNSRPLPDNHSVLWGNVEAGALRGGAG